MRTIRLIQRRLRRLETRQLIGFVEWLTLFVGFYMLAFAVLRSQGVVASAAAFCALINAIGKQAYVVIHHYCWSKYRNKTS